MNKTFEDYLMLIHAGEHIGTKETLVDGFDDWLGELEVDEIIGYADKALALQKKEILEKVEKMKETPANRGMFMWVQGYNQAIKALKKHLT